MSAVISEAGRHHLQWALIDGVGPLTFQKLLITFGTAEEAWQAPARALERVHRVGADKADQIASQRTTVTPLVDAEVAAIEQAGGRILCRADADYPAGLKQLPDPPIVLYVKGELRSTDAVAVAVVGTRRCSVYGSEQARRFGELLAGIGVTVVSGLARGIDAFAHHGALDADGRTLAVLGTGLGEIYPPENRALAERLVSSGALISELPVRAAVRRENFPSRNRIIAGLSLGTLVIEAPKRSGALITARLANEYNREVFALPGRVGDPNAFGTNALIRDGAAKLVLDLEDIVNELGEVGYHLQLREGAAAGHAPREQDTPAAGQPTPLTPIEQRVLALISCDPILQDVVIQNAEYPPGEALAALTSLELKRLIRRLPGQLVARVGQA
jgi:DNA processing protein